MSFDVITIYYIFLVLLVFDFWIWVFLEYLNKTRWTDELPVELSEIYDEEKYKKSMSYEREKYVFSRFSNIFFSFDFYFCTFLIFLKNIWLYHFFLILRIFLNFAVFSCFISSSRFCEFTFFLLLHFCNWTKILIQQNG